MEHKNKTMKATELIKKLVELVAQNGDADIIIDYDCRRITGIHHDEADLEYNYYGWIEIETEEEAEKDLELTWGDIMTIYLLVQVEWNSKKTDEEIYKEVLKRFKAKKGEEV